MRLVWKSRTSLPSRKGFGRPCPLADALLPVAKLAEVPAMICMEHNECVIVHPLALERIQDAANLRVHPGDARVV